MFFGEGGSDTLTGGGGSDTFSYLSAADSNGASGTAYDTITDFTAGTDKIRLYGTTVTAVDAAATGNLSTASFDVDLAAILGNGDAHQLNSGHAVLFTASGGDLSGDTFLVVGTSGAATGYVAGQDFVIHLDGAGFGTLTTTDFL